MSDRIASAFGEPPALLLVTDPSFDDARIVSVAQQVARALAPGAFGVQFRDKRPRGARNVRLASELRRRTRTHRAWFVVNGDIELARELEADGVHLGHDAPSLAEARGRLEGRSLWVSVAAHSDADVERACEGGADAVLVSPIGEAPGKGPPRGAPAVEAAARIAARHESGVGSRVAIYALGGIDPSLAADCRRAGATGVAVIRALLSAKDPAQIARSLVAPALRD